MAANQFESKLGGITVTGQAHSLSAWFVLALRLMMGYAFLYSGWVKVVAPQPFSAKGYLLHAVPKASPMYDMFIMMGQSQIMLDFLAIAIPWGEVLIGLGVLVGALTRLAAFFGAFMMLTFYFGNWSVEHGFINGDFAYMLVFLAIAAFGAGRIIGLDNYIENYDVGGQPLIKKYPILTYILG